MDNKEKSFLGKGWSFPPAFDKKLGSVEMVSMEEDIRQSLEIYFGTKPGERIMRKIMVVFFTTRFLKLLMKT